MTADAALRWNSLENSAHLVKAEVLLANGDVEGARTHYLPALAREGRYWLENRMASPALRALANDTTAR